jgi:alpha-1,3-rhamnosyl/mannosyltransferase
VRIALDATAAAKPRRTGIGWYVSFLAQGLSDILGERDRLYLCTRLSRWKHRHHRLEPGNKRVTRRWFQEPFGPRGDPDVFHGPDFRLPAGGRCPLVATVQDVFELLGDEWSDARFRERQKARYAEVAERASQVIFPSECSKKEYLEHFPEARARANVVELAAHPAFAPLPRERVEAVRKRYGLPPRYALYVGEISTRKNLVGMARGLEASGVTVPWVWVGADSHGAQAIEAAVGELDVDVRRTGYVPFADLPAVYGGATLMTFVTHHEGFGMPALEAMACGIPAIVSDCGALPEVTAGCALEAAPEDPEAIGAAVRRLWEHEDARADLRARGLARARHYSWERAARETWAVYERALAAASARAA